MVDYISVTSVNNDGSLGLHTRFKEKADADDHAAIHNGWVAADPGGDPDHWILDASKHTITLDQNAEDAYQAALKVLGLAAERRIAYPPIGDQLDALWKGGDAQAAMKVLVDKVKSDNPKP
jgi:hypothetical protein